MVVLSPRGELVRLCREVFLVCRTRFLEWNWLKVTSRDGLAIVPANFEGSDAHYEVVIVVVEEQDPMNPVGVRTVLFKVQWITCQQDYGDQPDTGVVID